ncbi:MAG: CPBP family intramembrane glutamic endopeptidase, partial [Candidatus Woesearchaeota archaeon]
SAATIGLQSGIIIPIVSQIPMSDFFRQVFLEMSKQNGLLMYVAIVIAAPILEEFIFRGIILDGLLKRYAPLKSILLSSLLFGVFHLNLYQFISAFIISCLMGWVYYKTGNLLLGILIHMVNNTAGTIIGSLNQNMRNLREVSIMELYGSPANFYIITGGALAVLGIAILLLKYEFRKQKLSSSPLRTFRKFK